LRILLLDIETAPNLAYVWGLWKENIGTNQIVNSGYVMSWAAKWVGGKTIMFDSIMKSSHKQMISGVHRLLNDADVVVHYNGTSFDIPTLNKEFLLLGITPPAPYKQLDLMKIVKDKFRFPSNKLDYVAQTIKIGEKVRHEGFELWVKCMARDQAAWDKMEKYNIHDVVLLDSLYKRLLPWIDRHPNLSIGVGVVCPNCGSKHSSKQGERVLASGTYQRYQCQSCGKWFRSSKAMSRNPVERAVEIS
jgi:DNA polymerase elongation subunit (family B)